MKLNLTKPILLLLLGVAGLALSARAADDYTYTNLVDSTGALKKFGSLLPSINNRGAVVFHASFDPVGMQPGGEGIYIAEGGSYRGIAVSGGVYRDFRANPTLNDNGFVAFQSDLADGSEGVFVGDGKTTGNRTVATNLSGRLNQFTLVIGFAAYGLGIDGNATAVFRANFQQSRRPGFFAGDGSKQETQLFADGAQGQDDAAPATNASGVVAFGVGNIDGTQQILRTTTAGGTPTTLVTTAGDSPFSSFGNGSISINNAGVVAFVATLKAGGYGVYTSDGSGTPKMVIDTISQPSLSRFGSVSINNTGSIAVATTLTSGGANILVIGPADVKFVIPSNLFGSTLAGFYNEMTPRALNDKGEFVFWYRLANGTQGIAIAIPSNGVQVNTLGNISSRVPVLGGDNTLIGGFIITGTENKNVAVRAIGPSLAAFGISGALPDPVLELHRGDGALIARNDNWKDTQQADIQASGLAPKNDLEATIITTLTPGSYTAIVTGKNGGTGIGVVETYDLTQSPNSKLGNIATRAFVGSGDNVLIAGFIAGPNTRTVIRAIGPTLGNYGIANYLTDPTLELHNSNGDILTTNNNWKDTQEAEIRATGLQPNDDRESAILQTLAAGNYTAIVRGTNNRTGIGLAEVYNLQ